MLQSSDMVLLNSACLSMLQRLAIDNGFTDQTLGFQKFLTCSDSEIEYQIIKPLPERPDDCYVDAKGEMLLWIGVNVPSLEEILTAIVPTEIDFGPFTFITASDLYINKRICLKKPFTVKKCEDAIATLFSAVISVGEEKLRAMADPKCLRHTLVRSELILEWKYLIWREVAHAILDNEFSDAVKLVADNQLGGSQSHNIIASIEELSKNSAASGK